jgi:NOL1/NOP2/sun family putative RNA methylase
MSRYLGAEFPAFVESLQGQPQQGLRVNTLKLPTDRFLSISPYPLGEPIPWCSSAFHLQETEFSFGKHPYHLAGLYYLQDPSAMTPAELLAPLPGERVLDLAAAPGGKTTHLAALMQGQGLLVANEIKDNRLGHLVVNVDRWGAGNVVVTNETPERLADHFGPYFDRVLVDAPCSGEGMFRKDSGARLDWSPEMVEGCAWRQQKILHLAAKVVRPGGHLLYSTCTFAPEEDEGVIANLIQENPEYEVVPLPLSNGFLSGQPRWLRSDLASAQLEGAVRLFPHRLRGEGHFACLLRRGDVSVDMPIKSQNDRFGQISSSEKTLWETFSRDIFAVDFPEDRLRLRGERLYLVPPEMTAFGSLRVAVPGVWLGTFKKERFEPAHPLALYLRPGQGVNTLDLSCEEWTEPSKNGKSFSLQAYLRGETIPSTGPSGWTLVTTGGWPIGWGKRVQGVLKNHFPRGWQIHS